LVLETGVVSGARAREAPPRWRWASSIVLHGAVLCALLVLPLLKADDLPSPAALTRAFFLEPSSASPPPAPPAARARPAAARTSRLVPSTRPVASGAPTVAAASTEEPAAAPAAEAHAEDGVPGGVEGGVPGGIVGGVIGGTADPEPTTRSEVRVGVDVK